MKLQELKNEEQKEVSGGNVLGLPSVNGVGDSGQDGSGHSGNGNSNGSGSDSNGSSGSSGFLGLDNILGNIV